MDAQTEREMAQMKARIAELERWQEQASLEIVDHLRGLKSDVKALAEENNNVRLVLRSAVRR
jgi:hypothetical protein